MSIFCVLISDLQYVNHTYKKELKTWLIQNIHLTFMLVLRDMHILTIVL